MMVYALTSDQVEQVVENTLLVLLGRPDLLAQWHDNLADLLKQAQAADLYEEALFVAAVLTLLNAPDDRLPTGTVYDRAWESIMIGIQTGVVHPAPASDETEHMTLDRLLASVIEATAVMVRRSDQEKKVLRQELQQMQAAATEAGVPELATWIDDVLAVLSGKSVSTLGEGHMGIYEVYWDALRDKIERGD